MHPGLLLEVREAVNTFDRSQLLAQARELLRARSREGIQFVMEQLKVHAPPPPIAHEDAGHPA